MCNMATEQIVPRIAGFFLAVAILAPMSGAASDPKASVVILETKGYLVPARQVNISPTVRGQVVELFIDEGKQVKAGEVLARLDSNEYKLALKLAVARLRLAEAELIAAKKDERSVEVAKVEAKVEVARSEVAIAENHLECTSIRAPFDGIVLVKHAEVGTLIDSKASQVAAHLCVLADLRTMDVEAWVSERDLKKIAEGQACVISVEAFPETKYRGRVFRLMPSSDRARAAVSIRVRMEVPAGEKRLRPELGAIVGIQGKE